MARYICITLHCIALHLHCIAMHCTALHRTALSCTALSCTALHCTLQCNAVHCIVLQCIVLHCIAMQCSAVQCSALHRFASHCIALHCSAVQCIVLHCIKVHCIAVQCSALYYTTSRLVSSAKLMPIASPNVATSAFSASSSTTVVSVPFSPASRRRGPRERYFRLAVPRGGVLMRHSMLFTRTEDRAIRSIARSIRSCARFDGDVRSRRPRIGITLSTVASSSLSVISSCRFSRSSIRKWYTRSSDSKAHPHTHMSVTLQLL